MEILIIESETYLAASLAQKLESDGHICTLCAPGNSVQGHFDIVLLGTFFDPMKVIKEYEHSVIILLVNYINSDITKALKAGASDYILKPIIIEELKRKINFFSNFRCMKMLNNSYEAMLDVQSQNVLVDEKKLAKIRLPLQIISSNIEYCDIVVFTIARLKKMCFARTKNDLSILKSNSQISYFTDFDDLTQKEQQQILSSNNKKIIIRSCAEIEGLTKYTISEKEPSIMPIDEYIKFCILKYQEQCSDTQLAEILGISRKSLWEKRRRYGIIKRKTNKN